MFGRKKKSLHARYDKQLLDEIYHARELWIWARKTEENVVEVDQELMMQTKLQRAKFQYYYREARRRQLKGDTITTDTVKYSLK